MGSKSKARMIQHLLQVLDSLAATLTSDDIPLSIAALPAAMHFIEALQGGLPQGDPPTLVKITEEEYARQFPENFAILMRELDPTWVDPRAQPEPAAEPRRRSRLL